LQQAGTGNALENKIKIPSLSLYSGGEKNLSTADIIQK
jgi:hypothetical protein